MLRDTWTETCYYMCVAHKVYYNKSDISIFRKLKHTKRRQEEGKDVLVFIAVQYATYGSDLDHIGNWPLDSQI
jgi:hypothetical protein